VLADALLKDQDVARFEAVMGPKADGAWHLHCLAGDVDFFVLFASAAGVLGSSGQGNHAAANAFLDVLAHLRRRQGLPTTSIDWGAWSGVGAASRLQVEEQLRGTGMNTISPTQGLAALDQIMQGLHAQVAVLPIDWPVLLARYNDTAVPSLFAEMVAAAPAVAGGEAAPVADFLTRLRQTPSNSRYELLLTQVTAMAHSMLGLVPDDDLDPARPLNEYGLDSLMVVEMRNRLSGLINADLPATLLFSYPSIAALTDYLADEVLGLARPAQQAPDDMPDHLVDEVKNLSEDELDSILRDFAREHLEEQ
jgi:polyketide synthase 12/myxalamid-type polyketide synthase MxaB